jgi:malate dehydrogenase
LKHSAKSVGKLHLLELPRCKPSKPHQRGTAVPNARGSSSAASAANAAIDHMRDWLHGTNGRWVSMGIASSGSYGIPEGLVCGVPVTCTAGLYHRVDGLPIDDFARSMIDRTVAELREGLATTKA